MSRTWQSIKFFIGIFLFGILFILLCRAAYIYAVKYIEEEPKPFVREEFSVKQEEFEQMRAKWEEEREQRRLEILQQQKHDQPGNDTGGFTGEVIIPDPTDPAPDSPQDKHQADPSADDEPEPAADEAAIDYKAPLDMALERTGGRKGDPLFIRIIKENRLLELWIQPNAEGPYALLKKYDILGMSGNLGPKTKQGDLQAPEGFYRAYRSSLNPNSNYHLSFNIGYPNAWDKFQNRTGSLIMVHGSNVSVGCFAMGNGPIEEIYGMVEATVKGKHGREGVPIHVYPFVPTQLRLLMESRNKNHSFWCFLADAWVWTEENLAPPPVLQEKGLLSLEESELHADPSGKHTYINGQLIRLQRQNRDLSSAQ